VVKSTVYTRAREAVSEAVSSEEGPEGTLPAPRKSASHLLAHGIKVALHPVDTNRDTVDERKRLRVLGQHRGERSRDNVSKLWVRDFNVLQRSADIASIFNLSSSLFHKPQRERGP